MKDSFDLAMDLVADIARNPAFAPEEIERQKEQITSTQQVNANDPDYIASAVFDRLVYGFHPHGLPGSGTPETLASITRDDLRQFHRQHFVPNNMVLAIVGDITQKEAAAPPSARSALAARRGLRLARCRSPSRRAASSSSTSRMRCRRRSASGSWRFRESIRTT